MKRIIKFRAWDAEKNTMYFPNVLSFVEGKVSSFVLCDDGNRKYVEHKLMQFTGLQDNKELIFMRVICQGIKWCYRSCYI
jgi:uncharacterized phage protein (TIGR01671 family)